MPSNHRGNPPLERPENLQSLLVPRGGAERQRLCLGVLRTDVLLGSPSLRCPLGRRGRRSQPHATRDCRGKEPLT